MNIAYDGEIFNTWAELAAYCAEKFGETWSANYTHLENYGCDLNGQEMFMNGTVYAGRTRLALDALGLGSQSDAVQTLTNNAQQSYNSWADVANTRSAETATIAGSQYTNTAIQLGTEEAQGGQVLIATKPIVTSNGTVMNQPSVSAVKEIEDPTVPGTFSYLATLKALGWLPVSPWAAVAAPALGIGLGVGLYSVNPQLWEKISRTLLPFCYDDNGTPKMPISVDSDGTVYTPEDAIEALRQLFIEEGVYITDSQVIVQPTGMTLPSWYTFPFDVYSDTIYGMKRSTESNYPAYNVNGSTKVQVFIGKRSESGSTDGYLVAASPNPNTVVGYTSSYPLSDFSDVTMNHEYTFNDRTVYYIYMANSARNGVNYSSDGGNLKDFGMVDLRPDTDYWLEKTAWMMVYGSESGGGAEGATPEPGATYPTDTTQTLAEIYPTWYDNGIDVLSNPAKTLFEEGVEKWLPLALSDTNYSDNTDDSYSTKNQADSQSGENTDDNQIEQIIEALRDLTETLTENATLPPDPTIPSDPSGETPSPTPPVITGAGSDLIAIYNPTKAQIQAFNQFLWDLDPTNLVNWKKVIANPIEAVISLHMIYATPVTGETRNIKCGYIETDVPSVIVTNQYTDIDCGTVDIAEYFHNVWDYIGTHIEIYLPFVGIVPLHVSDVMNSTIKVRYRVDVYTGACLAQVIVYKGNSFGTLYTYAGNCAVPLPLTSGSFTGVFSSLLATAGTAVFGGGPAMALGELAGHALSGHMQQNIQRSGSIGSNVGALGIRTPYLIITRKVPLDAHLYQTQYGFPANKTVTLGSVSGYTRVKDIHLSGIPCTDDELEQIESLLKDGVIIN